MKISQTLVLAILVLAELSLTLQISAAHDIQHQFCWKDSYGRGVGTIPNDCGRRQKIGLLCYDYCPQGYSRFGFDCHQQCPPGFRDDGLFCRNAQYGRGAGFPWKFGDGLNDRGMFSRCQASHGQGNCEKNGLIVYPKCRPGFYNIGCCICRPPKPNCQALGMNGGIDLSCAKKLQIGDPKTADCSPGKQYDTGLCYKSCQAGYYGVGPVCWANTPNGWVGCGMGSAKTSRACAEVIVGQVASVGQIAVNVATFGSSGSATAAAASAKNVGKIAKLKQQFQALKKAVMGSKQMTKISQLAKQTKKARQAGQKIKEGYDKAADAADAVQALGTLSDSNVTEADIVRISAQIAALADPTGIASAVEAYSHPKCSQIFRR